MERFIDFLLAKGKIKLEHFNLIDTHKTMQTEYGYDDIDMVLFYDILTQDIAIDLFNEYSGRELLSVCPKVTEDMIDIYHKHFKEKIHNAVPICIDKDDFIVGTTELDSSRIQKLINTRMKFTNVKMIRISRYHNDITLQKLDSSNKELFSKRLSANDLLLLLCIDAIENGSTDIHITTETAEIYDGELAYVYPVYFRVGANFLKWTRINLDASMNKFLTNAFVNKAGCNTSDLEHPDGVSQKISDLLGCGRWGARVQANSCLGGYHCIIRIHDNNKRAIPIDKLGFNKLSCNKIKSIAKFENGLILVLGSVGAGKNVTTYSMLQYSILNKKKQIIEYSSPVEVRMPYTQFDYNDNIAVLESYVKAAKKSDPDITFVGEIPNNAVAQAIKDLFLSSIGVIATSHVERGWDVIQKIELLYGEDFISVISHLNGVIVQKMFQRVCSNCGVLTSVHKLKTKERMVCNNLGITGDVIVADNSGDCPLCIQGYEKNGLNPVAEVIEFDDDIHTELFSMKGDLIAMGNYLKEYLFKEKLAMEFSVRDLILNHKIDIKQVIERNLTRDIKPYL